MAINGSILEKALSTLSGPQLLYDNSRVKGKIKKRTKAIIVSRRFYMPLLPHLISTTRFEKLQAVKWDCRLGSFSCSVLAALQKFTPNVKIFLQNVALGQPAETVNDKWRADWEDESCAFASRIEEPDFDKPAPVLYSVDAVLNWDVGAPRKLGEIIMHAKDLKVLRVRSNHDHLWSLYRDARSSVLPQLQELVLEDFNWNIPHAKTVDLASLRVLKVTHGKPCREPCKCVESRMTCRSSDKDADYVCQQMISVIQNTSSLEELMVLSAKGLVLISVLAKHGSTLRCLTLTDRSHFQGRKDLRSRVLSASDLRLLNASCPLIAKLHIDLDGGKEGRADTFSALSEFPRLRNIRLFTNSPSKFTTSTYRVAGLMFWKIGMRKAGCPLGMLTLIVDGNPAQGLRAMGFRYWMNNNTATNAGIMLRDELSFSNDAELARYIEKW